MLKEIIIAIQSYFEAHQFIRKHKMWKWILIPGIIYTVLFMFGMYYFWSSANGAVSWLSKTIGLENWLQRQRSEWLSFFFVMGGMMLRIILLFFYFSLFKYIILIVGSPVFGYLSEKTAHIIEGKEFTLKITDLAKDALRGITLAVRNSLWQTVYLFTLLLVALIPLVGWITPLVALFMECYFYGFSMVDYSLQRDKMSTMGRINFIGSHRGLSIGNGLMFYLMHLFIIVGWIMAPAYAVIAATLSLYQVKNN